MAIMTLPSGAIRAPTVTVTLLNSTSYAKWTQGHNAHVRERMQTGHGASNLARGIEECNLHHGADNETATGARRAQQTIKKSISEHMPAKHRALIALHCEAPKHPFNTVNDSVYVQEVTLLRPGTVLPPPSTVSRDMSQICLVSSNYVRGYFSVCPFFVGNAYVSKIMCKTTRNTKHLSVWLLTAGRRRLHTLTLVL